MTGKPKAGTRTFGIPGDLPRMRALGIVRKGRWTRKDVERQLAVYERGTAPDGLAGHMKDLQAACAAVRRLLADDDLAAAAARMDDIVALVQDIRDRVAAPHTKRGLKVIESARAGGEKRRGVLAPDTQNVLAEMRRLIDAGHSVAGAASAVCRRGTGTSAAANRQLWNRHRGKAEAKKL